MYNLIVVDTSVVISALISPEGPSREVLRRCLTGHYIPLMSNALFLEYEGVSARQSIQEKFSLRLDKIQELLNAFYRISRWVHIYYLWRPNLLDENDNFLLELAVAGNGKYIITNNIKDFKRSELLFPDIQIWKPEEILRSK